MKGWTDLGYPAMRYSRESNSRKLITRLYQLTTYLRICLLLLLPVLLHVQTRILANIAQRASNKKCVPHGRSKSLGWNSSGSWWTASVSDCDPSSRGAVQSDSTRPTAHRLLQSRHCQQNHQQWPLRPSLCRRKRLQCVSVWINLYIDEVWVKETHIVL